MRILYVEDDPMNRRVVQDMLNVVGAEMTEAHDGEHGLRIFDEQDFDLVLMDLRMPGMDGFATIELMRARGDSKANTPIIVVTADTSPDLHDCCLKLGANEILRKPIAMHPLLKAITQTIAARQTKVA
jgi:CheY-like chemotaxis protein